jgi:hypothetical protein
MCLEHSIYQLEREKMRHKLPSAVKAARTRLLKVLDQVRANSALVRTKEGLKHHNQLITKLQSGADTATVYLDDNEGERD